MLDPLGFPIFVAVFGGIMMIRYLINRCDKTDNERRILIINSSLNDNDNNLNNREIPPKYEELPPRYEE